MHRTLLLDKLKVYKPFNSDEIVYKNSIINFIQKHPDCFERYLEIGHITASAFLLNKDKTHVLLMHHNKLNKWVQLGGHCDGDSDVLAVALKEAQEESGIKDIIPVMDSIFDIDVHYIPENPKEKAHYHYDIRFLLQVVSNEEIVKNHESKELRWVTQDLSQFPTTSESMVRMVKKWTILT